MKIVVAPNAFKNSLSADEAARAIITGLQKSSLRCECLFFPVGDGGDGTGALLASHLRAKEIYTGVHDPLGIQIESHFFLTDHHVAIIELADASGLRLVERAKLNPLKSSTFGTGELIKCALDHQATEVILCVGGSATVDGATGILRALGVKFINADGVEITALPEKLNEISHLDVSKLDSRLMQCSITILCDVDNPITGINGSAKIFGPQKGATPSDVLFLEKGLKHLCDILKMQFDISVHGLPKGGAAGGVSGVLHAVIGSSLVSGIEFFLKITRFDEVLIRSNLVITGEGNFDDQTLQGKGPMGVALAAKERSIEVIGICGKVSVSDMRQTSKYFDRLMAIQSESVSLDEAIAYAANNLEQASFELGNILANR
jgi:glycerate 2-kinase